MSHCQRIHLHLNNTVNSQRTYGQPEPEPRLQEENKGHLCVIFLVSRLKSCILSSILDKGKSVTVAVRDRCTGCAFNDLDFSPAAFDKLASRSVGRIHGVQWDFV